MYLPSSGAPLLCHPSPLCSCLSIQAHIAIQIEFFLLVERWIHNTAVQFLLRATSAKKASDLEGEKIPNILPLEKVVKILFRRISFVIWTSLIGTLAPGIAEISETPSSTWRGTR
ncbi:hypothetical protein FRC18_004911 [Serendipita sp. 400]|nr:hypothetical protein FRC18_004911 [Serendipita sp. 400]